MERQSTGVKYHKMRWNARLAFAVATRGTPSVGRNRLKKKWSLFIHISPLSSPPGTQRKLVKDCKWQGIAVRQNLGDLGHQNALRIDACHLLSQICRQILLKQGCQTAHSQVFLFSLESLFSTWKEWACFLLTVKREVSSDSVFLNKTNFFFFFFKVNWPKAGAGGGGECEEGGDKEKHSRDFCTKAIHFLIHVLSSSHPKLSLQSTGWQRVGHDRVTKH